MALNPSKRRKLDHGHRGDLDPGAMDSKEDTAGYVASSTSEDDGVVGAGMQSQSAARKSRRPVGKPTMEGVDAAVYAGGVFNSNLFKLQVDALLTEMHPDYEKRLRGVDDALHRMKSLIESIQDRHPLSVVEAADSLKKSHGITIPYPDPKPEPSSAYKLMYARPTRINVVGSYALKTMAREDSPFSVDMVVVMPETIFQEKDHLNYRYFYKRAYYLACIAAGFQDMAAQEFELEYDCLHGNSLHAVLVVKQRAEPRNNSPGWEIRLIPSVSSTLFSASKLKPDKNSIRPKNVEGESSLLLPSPFYNASITSDLHVEPYHKLLCSAAKQSNEFKDACMLGRIWLRQRGFDSRMCNGGFGYFEWAAITALLLKGGASKGHSILSAGYSSYQMFKAILQFISVNDLAAQPFLYEAGKDRVSSSGTPIFFDGPRGHNVLYKMTTWSYKLLQDETQASLSMFNDSNFDPFDSAFILKVAHPLFRFDYTLRITCSSKGEAASGDHVSLSRGFSTRLFGILQHGLTDRVKLIHVQESDNPRWGIKTSRASMSKDSVLVCFIFDTANIDRLVDHGPPAEDKKQAAKFQRFWGDKAELRRFKDGSILESLVWTSGSSYAIFTDIITYLITRHFGKQEGASLETMGEEFQKLLPSLAACTKQFGALNEAFKSFESQIKELEGLPLQLRAFSASDSQLRSSSILSPTASASKPINSPASVHIQFEGSGRWPDDVTAIQRTKIAFLLRIGELVDSQKGVVATRLGLENEARLLENCAFLDVISESGASFRLRIHNEREQALLERQLKDRTLDQRTRDEVVSALSAYRRTFIHGALLTQAISTQCTRFPILSPTIRLVKMWFSRHMLLRHVSEEFVELLVAYIFLQPYPWRAPSSVMTGFLRTLLFLSKWDWRSTPLIVDFSGTMTTEQISPIHTRLKAWRKIDPGMNRTVVVAASNHDTTGTAYTDQGPSKMIAARMTALARSACKMVKEKGLDVQPKSLFATSTAEYDFILYLSRDMSGNRHPKSTSQSRFKNIEVQTETNLNDIGHEPIISFLDEIESLYGSHVVFFYDRVVGTVITGLWNPSTTAKRSFKVNLSYATKPAKDASKDGAAEVALDKSAILAEIGRLGGNLISRIEVREK